ncbi:MAG: hypothetical protein FJZ47_01845 [Candidatus Tectomicrobia bacterium]|uniref:Uncharacterized protein n=1 Tax=Tectimicrobiota bacterium TaxID=2528274 RepID=A0A937VZJ9_UNCTE|nr:hypothetical protein [Candidatus Tectomicrobia bacterium]
MPHIPRLQIIERDAGRRFPVAPDVLQGSGHWFIVGLQGYTSEVNLGVIAIEPCPPYGLDEEAGPQAFVEVARIEPLTRVPLPQACALDETLGHDVAHTLQELLALPEVPSLRLEQRETSPLHPPSILQSPEGPCFFLGVVGEVDAVRLVVYALTPPEDAPAWGAEIRVGVHRTPLALALAASLALTLARRAQTKVGQLFHAWTRLHESSPDAFARAVAIPGPGRELHQAAACMYAALPIGQYEAAQRAQETSSEERCL